MARTHRKSKFAAAGIKPDQDTTERLIAVHTHLSRTLRGRKQLAELRANPKPPSVDWDEPFEEW